MTATLQIADLGSSVNRFVFLLPVSVTFTNSNQDRPLNGWARDDLEDFLDAIVRHEGRGDYASQTRCAECRSPGTQEYQCDECFSQALYCVKCTRDLHKDNPFHIIKRWTGSCFERTDLRTLGLRVQLGHIRGAGNERKEEIFCVVDSNAIHEVAIDFCTCGSETSRADQLLRLGLYPATTTRPRSAATFRVLRKFHKLSFESKCSAYEFYNALARETNNTGNFQPRDRYNAFLRMTREWRHLMMLKRSGRCHMEGGARNIPPGACALLCPACPQPGKNLDVGGEWKRVHHTKRFLYALFLAIDANFRMKRKQVSSEEADPGLNHGAAFYSEVRAYMDHVGKHWDMEQEKSTCVSHDAVDLPDREARGTASSGIGTVDCARHNMKRPNGVGDLQKGERYINMDYMLWMSLHGYDELVQLMISYDIVCQWHINIWRRLVKYSPKLIEAAGEGGRRFYVWLIPKFHLPAHIESCNILYSFDLTPFVGMTDGEAPERGWANANPLATSTKEMGPGARRDTLDDHFNDWNHKKIIALGSVMLERVKKAVRLMVETQQELVETEASLPLETLDPWTKAMELWELDPSNPNPFDVMEQHESLQAIRGRIAEDVKDAVDGDGSGDVVGHLHVSEMISMGMQLEHQQRELASDAGALKTHATAGQKTTMVERGNKLRRKIANWIKTQSDFQPIVTTLRAADDQARAAAARSQPTAGVPVQGIELWLPSKQVRVAGSSATLKESHCRYEFDMREALAFEALEEMRRLLLVRTYHYKFQARNTAGVAGGTRARTAIDVLDERIRRQANEYRAARRALVGLGPRLKETRWTLVLKELGAEDVRGMPRALFHDAERKKKKKRKRQTDEGPPVPKEMSWIWRTGLSSLTAQAASSEDAARKATDEGLRVQWAKARARARRWSEEVDLLEEEMRRILVFLEWRASWWRALKDARPKSPDEDVALREGLHAYAERQAEIRDEMKGRFRRNWTDVPRWIEMGREGVATAMAAAHEGESDDDAFDTGDEDEPVPLLARNMVAVSDSLVENSLLPAE
ncbi:hypothetical protein B0H15DRAFT_777021 [Mycena belliarum]|uniref:CxC2-like cysteine cluster KDZ transposase-associated domain-containing protein n=1 Tax=Mycena belliarum TaxID=1033014 RepID=A0AAD6U8D9_9AGAR|nr:hypothetical protein B0H15DRAFT_777021 [Mycena belliae]